MLASASLLPTTLRRFPWQTTNKTKDKWFRFPVSRHNRGYDEAADGPQPTPEVERAIDED